MNIKLYANRFAAIALSLSLMMPSFVYAVVVPDYYINQDAGSPVVSGMRVTLAGTAGSTKAKGTNPDDQTVCIDWSDGSGWVNMRSNVDANDEFTILTSGGSGANKFFTATWTAGHDYTVNGTYTIYAKVNHANCAGADGSDAATITVGTVVINTAPVITLTGDATVNLTEGDSYTDAGATASDTEDGDITASIVVGGDTVDTNTPGTYVITYNVTDTDGASATQVTRTVIVAPAPNTPPTVTLNGSNPMALTVGDTFTDPGATGNDAEDGAITPVVTGTVDTSTAGSYVLSYTVTDSGSLSASVTRTVNVNATTPKDTDGDTISDTTDNCPLNANTDQLDTDSDGTGNVCDIDDDNDGDEDTADNCPLNANSDQADNDADGVGNVCDATPDPVPTPTPAPTPTSGGGGGSSSAGGWAINMTSIATPSTGQVLGAFTDASGNTCSELITTYMHRGWTNDKAEVIKLQQFLLDRYPASGLEITGFFGPRTESLLKQFQRDNATDVLVPWKEIGVNPQLRSTGFLFITTKHTINKMACSTLNVTRPPLF